MEVIWGNRLKPGDFKYIGGFPHFVADGGDDRVGQWLEQETDRDRTILFNSNTFRDGQYAKKALLVLEALTADDRRRLGADYAAVIVESARRPAEATSIPE